MSGRVLVDLCAGTASVSLRALGLRGPRGGVADGLTGFMGSKARWADEIVALLDAGEPDEVVLVDAGPWGDVWDVVRAGGGEAIAGILDAFEGADPSELWRVLALAGGDRYAPARIARYLWVQARSANCVPVWWDEPSQSWQSPTGSRTEIAHETRTPRKVAGATQAALRQKSTPNGCRGIVHPATIARRLRAICALPWDRVRVVRHRVENVEPIPGAVVYFDPPYIRSPRYAVLCSRPAVLETASRWAAAGCRVLVSEGEPLPLGGWTPIPLSPARKDKAGREWVTASWRVPVAPQLVLPGLVA